MRRRPIARWRLWLGTLIATRTRHLLAIRFPEPGDD